MNGLTNAMANLTTNEERLLPNGLHMKRMSHPTREGYTEMTVTGNLMGSSIQFVGNISETPDDMPLTVLHFFGALAEATGGYRVHVFGAHDAYGIGVMKEIADGRQELVFTLRNSYRDMFVQQFERV